MAVQYCLFRLDHAGAEDVAILDREELDQARSYVHERDRRRFVARRAGLRRLLASRIGCHPRRVAYRSGRHGKPSVPGGPSFSLSHARDHALVAIGDGALGCDIEWRDDAVASPDMARRYFRADEIAELDGLPAAAWLDGFFACWSRKEAYVKALGFGLSYPLDAFRVSVDPRAPARLIDALPGWRLHAFEPLPGLHAAIVSGEDAAPIPASYAARAIGAAAEPSEVRAVAA